MQGTIYYAPYRQQGQLGLTLDWADLPLQRAGCNTQSPYPDPLKLKNSHRQALRQEHGVKGLKGWGGGGEEGGREAKTIS